MQYPGTVFTSMAIMVTLVTLVDRTDAECNLDTVKISAYQACEYISDHLYEEHHNHLKRRSRRNVAAHSQSRPTSVSDSETANGDSDGSDSDKTEGQHHFERRYNRPTHLSIRNLTDGYLVMDYAHAKILRRHNSHSYKYMRMHYYNHNGTMKRRLEDVDGTVHRHHRQRPTANHRHHPEMVSSSSSSSAAAATDDTSNDILVVSRRARHTSNEATLALSSCCRNIEQCMHIMCPMR